MSRALAPAGAVALSVLIGALAGCDSEREVAGHTTMAPPVTTTTAPSSRPATERPTVAPDPSPYEMGTVLRHLPARCPHGRIYVNVRALFDMAGVSAKVGRSLQQLSPATKGPQSDKVLEVLEHGGLDPRKAIQELALCIKAKGGNTVLAAGLELGTVRDPLGLIAKAAAAGLESPPQLRREGAMAYLEREEQPGVIAQVAPHVIAFAPDKQAARALTTATAVPASFANATEHVVLASVPSDPQTNVELMVTDRGSELNVRVVVAFAGRTAASLKKDPEAFVRKLRADAAALADRLSSGPLAVVGKRIRTAEFAASGTSVIITATLPESEIPALLDAFAQAGRDSLAVLAPTPTGSAATAPMQR